MCRRYFSAESAHGSDSSYGFSNDTIVLAFDNKRARDRYVAESRNLSCEAIRFDQVTTYAANYDTSSNRTVKPRPFSGDFWGIVESRDCVPGERQPDGLIGEVQVCYYGHPGLIQTLYR